MELLSPAGSPESFKAALESGANAIYLGLPWFNARRPALNFTPETLKQSLKEAHNKGVKVYITLNTDIKPTEIEDAAKVLTLLADLKVDAVIIKDFGLYYMARECFPSLELHLSTQFGISNSYAAEMAKKLGASRIIPARELSFLELKALKESGRDIPEIEAFVQGSMCFSFSGKCLLSSWVGGKSANRGVCQAPCRLKYSNKTTEFPFFSMKDLNLASHLKDLKDANISSLKIEGRLKSPGWVSNITSIYTNALKGEFDPEKSSSELLKHSGREMGEGFTTGRKELTAKHRAKFGVFLGKVIDLNIINGETFAELDFSIKSPETSLRFVTEDDEFLTIIHQDNAIINNHLLKSNGKIEKGALVYEVIPGRNTTSGIGKMRYDIELEVVEDNIKVSVITDTNTFTELDPYKKVVKAKRGVYPDSVYDKIQDKVVNGWRFNKLYSEDILMSKTQVNSIVKIVSYILAVTIQESNPLNQVELSNNTNKFLEPYSNNKAQNNKEFIRISANSLTEKAPKTIIIGNDSKTIIIGNDSKTIIIGNDSKTIIIDEVINNKLLLDKIISINKGRNIAISLFPICFEKDMEDIKEIVLYLEKNGEYNYEINDIGHYNLLVNYLAIPVNRIIGGQGISCYNILSIKFLREVLGINSISIPLELDSRGVIKLVEDNSSEANLLFTELSTVPVMYSRVDSEDFYEGAEFIDKIGTVFYVHKYKDINIFIAKDYFSSDGCKDLDGINFYGTIKNSECLIHPEVTRQKFNLERRLY